MLAYEVPDPPAPLLSKLSRMRRRQDAPIRMPGHQPWAEQDAAVGALCRAGRHEDSKVWDISPLYRLKLFNEQSMMARRLEAAQPAPFSE